MVICHSTNQSHQIQPKNALLLPEILHQVFLQLSLQDLKTVLLVCGLWRELGEAPGLWSGLHLNVTRNNIAFMPQLLKSRRMKTVRKLTLETVSDELLQAVIRHKGLREIDANGTDLSGVEASLLARAVTGMEDVDIEDTQLTGQQVDAVLTATATASRFHRFGCKDDIRYRLKKLDISFNNLSTMEPGMMARAAFFLEELSLFDTHS